MTRPGDKLIGRRFKWLDSIISEEEWNEMYVGVSKVTDHAVHYNYYDVSGKPHHRAGTNAFAYTRERFERDTVFHPTDALAQFNNLLNTYYND